MLQTPRLHGPDPTEPVAPPKRGRWDLAVARVGARLIHPLRYEYGGFAWTVVILLAVIGAGGPVVVEKKDDAALAACVQRQSVGQCKAAGADVALDGLHRAFAGTTTPNQARGPNDLGLVATRVESLTGDEEAVLLVLGHGDDASAFLGALVADGAVRLGTGTYTLPSSPWRVYPLDMTWREARAIPPTSSPWAATIATLLMLGGPIPLCWLVTHAIVRPLRDATHRASTYALLRTLREVAGAVAGLGLLGSFALGSVRTVVLVDWLYRRFLTSTPKVWDVEEMYVLAGMLIVTFFGTLAYGALELICWPDELEDLSVVLRRPHRDITPSGALTSDTPDSVTHAGADAGAALASGASEARTEAGAHDVANCANASVEALRRGAGPQDPEALQASQLEQLRDTASRHASLADRELLRVIDAWPAEQPGVGVLLPLGIHPPPVPWTQLAEDGTPGAADDAWGAHLGRAHSPTEPTTSGEDEQERARDARRAEIKLRMDTARFQRVQAVQRLVALQYIRLLPDRIELMPLGRSILALPPMALVDDIPFDVQRDLAVAEDLLAKGQAVGAIQKNALFLEDYLKKLLLAFAPASLAAPPWKRAEAKETPFWKVWLELFRSGERAPSFRANFLADLDSLLRQRLRDAAATLPDEVVLSLNARRSPPLETLGLVLQGIKVLDTKHAKVLSDYLGGVPGDNDLDDATRGAVYAALSKLDRRKVDAAYTTWQGRFADSIADCTLGTLVHTTAALLPVLMKEGDAAGRHAHLLDGHTLLVHNAGIRIRELRNATMHHREQVALSDAKTIRMAEHMLWLTRIFVTSVEAARQGASVGRRHG